MDIAEEVSALQTFANVQVVPFFGLKIFWKFKLTNVKSTVMVLAALGGPNDDHLHATATQNRSAISFKNFIKMKLSEEM